MHVLPDHIHFFIVFDRLITTTHHRITDPLCVSTICSNSFSRLVTGRQHGCQHVDYLHLERTQANKAIQVPTEAAITDNDVSLIKDNPLQTVATLQSIQTLF